MNFENTVRRNLSRSFRVTIISMFVIGILCGGNGAGLLIFGKGFSIGLFDSTISGILYLAIWIACMLGAATITKNGYKRGYALFLHQIDELGKREYILEQINAMSRYQLKKASGALLLIDQWGLAYAYHESFAVVPSDRVLKTRISSMVRSGDVEKKALETYLVVEYRGDESIRIPVANREEALEIIEKMEKFYRNLNK